MATQKSTKRAPKESPVFRAFTKDSRISPLIDVVPSGTLESARMVLNYIATAKSSSEDEESKTAQNMILSVALATLRYQHQMEMQVGAA